MKKIEEKEKEVEDHNEVKRATSEFTERKNYETPPLPRESLKAYLTYFREK